MKDRTNIIIIAEIGINHNGDINLAKKMINEAKIVGQTLLNFKKEISILFMIKKHLMLIEKVHGEKLIEIKRKVLNSAEKSTINWTNFGKKKKLDGFASAWDKNSLNFLKDINLNIIKLLQL